MSRTTKQDYEVLLTFIQDYSLQHTHDTSYLNKIIKPIHKSYYSALVLISELKHQSAEPNISCKDRVKQNKIFWLHLTESFSELGSAFFLIINGCYKAAEQVLRSSIENYAKALGSTDFEKLNEIKNIYQVFEKSGETRFFSNPVNKKMHDNLYKLYSELCSTVHTGAEKDMQNISAIGDFPAIDNKRSSLSKAKYLEIVQLYVSSLSIMFDTNFHKMHHINRDIVQLSLSKEALSALHTTIKS